jgi:hypothetical protein
LIEIKSFLRKDGAFYSLNENLTVEDPNYIEGAITINIYGIDLLTKSYWDYIDQLWCYISDCVIDISNNINTYFYFPDQPLKVEFENLADNKIKITLTTDDLVNVVVNKKELINSLIYGASEFFNIMKKIVPENDDAYDDVLSKLNEL